MATEEQTHSKWDELKRMREKRDNGGGTPVTVVGADGKVRDANGRFVATADQIKEENERLRKEAEQRDQGKTAEVIAAEKAEADRKAAEREKETTEAKAAREKKEADDAAAEEARKKAALTPTTVEVDIDGEKVQVPPELAAAFKKAEEVQAGASKDQERAKLKEEIRAELKDELTPVKTEAEIAAERAIADAERKAKMPKMPDKALRIENPDEYDKQMEAYLDARDKLTRDSTKEEIHAEIGKRDAAEQKETEKRARIVVRNDFYTTYPVLKESSDIADVVLQEAIDGLVKSGKLKGLKPGPEADKIRAELFASAASTATRRIVKLLAAGKKVIPPSPPPPSLAQSASTNEKPPKKEETEQPKTARDRYPKGSVSASLAEVRKRKLA
jgi:hypothetical protein